MQNRSHSFHGHNFRFIIAATIFLFLSVVPFSESEIRADPGNPIQPLPSFGWVSVAWDDDQLLLTLNNIEPGSFQLYDLDMPPRIVFDIPSRICAHNQSVFETYDFTRINLLKQLRASCTDDGTRIVLESRYPLFWQIISDENDRYVQIQCLLRFRQTIEELQLDEGTMYYARRYVTPSGQRLSHIVVSDPSLSRLRPRVVMASDVSTRNLTSLADMVSGSRAAAGINGGYFQWPGISLSLVMRYGNIIAPPQLHRPAFMVIDDDRYIMDYPPIVGRATSSSGFSWEADVINQVPGYGQTAILTPGHPSRIRENMVMNFAVVRDGTIVAVNPIDFDDFSGTHIIWSRRFSSSMSLLSIGESVDIDIYPDTSQYTITHALQGGPFLVRFGAVDVTSEVDDIGDDIANGRSARSAVGIDDSGRLYLVAIEGSSGSRSIGSSLEELAWTMVDLGCTWAINLDGGSSTGMAMTYNTPETGLPEGSRQLATALVLIDESGRMQGESFFF